MGYVDSSAARNRTIVKRVKAGESIQKVADSYFITRQRVSQIIHAAGLRYPYSRPQPTLNAHNHGTTTCYNRGCRCPVCRDAHNARMREFHRKRRQVAKDRLHAAQTALVDGSSL